MSYPADALFEIGSDSSEASTQLPELSIRPEQIGQIRDAFNRAGIVDQDERQFIVESVTVRAIASLRELRAVEAHRVLDRINQRGDSGPRSNGSAWDTREEETWIDKM